MTDNPGSNGKSNGAGKRRDYKTTSIHNFFFLFQPDYLGTTSGVFIVILKHPRTAKGNKLVLARSSVARRLNLEIRKDSARPISHKEPHGSGRVGGENIVDDQTRVRGVVNRCPHLRAADFESNVEPSA